MSRFTRRNLPHWQPNGRVFFITYRLFGSLPPDVLARLQHEREQLQSLPPLDGETPRDRALRKGRRMFALEEQALDEQLKPGSPGSRWLADPRIASLVVENLLHHQERLYHLDAFVVMPNHVHLLLEPLAEGGTGITPDNSSQPDAADRDSKYRLLSTIMHSLKSYTSTKANHVVGRTGTFWQDESFDHWVRDSAEYARIADYIHMNPVKAGLCRSPEDWRWSSAAAAYAARGSK